VPEVLGVIDTWPVTTVGVGVTDPQRTLACHGAVDTVLPLASVTKPLTAYAVLIAARDGLLHLDEPAAPTETKVPAGITVRHLLAHASGLPLEPDGLIGVPERRRIYSNWAFEVLGELVATRAGRPFADQLRLEVLEPLGMGSTDLRGSPAHAAHGTVTDLLAFGRELLAPTLLDVERLQEATQAAYPALEGVVPGFGRQSPNLWGLGFELKGHKDPHWTGSRLSPTTFGHFGRSGSFLWVDPTRGLACASLADRDFGPWSTQAWPALHDAVIEAFAS
jgi:CubicO group peptidase (beta-lactamase class C family)